MTEPQDDRQPHAGADRSVGEADGQQLDRGAGLSGAAAGAASPALPSRGGRDALVAMVFPALFFVALEVTMIVLVVQGRIHWTGALTFLGPVIGVPLALLIRQRRRYRSTFSPAAADESSATSVGRPGDRS